MYFDTHAHYDDEQFLPDQAELLLSMPAGGVTRIVNAACDIKSSFDSITLAEMYPFVYATVGIHPHDAKTMDDSALETLEKLSHHEKVVAIGEIGLDYHYDFSPRDVQKSCFIRQLDLAKARQMPVVIHEREAAQDCLDIIQQHGTGLVGVYHCYSGSWETAKILLNMGWYLSFTGVVTFKNARKALEVISNMPMDRIMIETDAPYLAPVPNRGKRNSSLNLPYIAAKIAELRNMTTEEVAAITMENGKRFFGIA